VVREPGIGGRNIGAGIECEPDEVFQIHDRRAALTHAEVDCGRGEQRAQALQPLRRQSHPDFGCKKYSGPAGHLQCHKDQSEFACLFWGPPSLQPRRLIQMPSLSEFVFGQLDHVQNVVGMFPDREIFVDKVNAVYPGSGEGRQGIFAGNSNDVAGEHFCGLDARQYRSYQRRVVLKKSLDLT